MVREAVERGAPLVVSCVGVVLFVASAAHHATEIPRIDRVSGPLLALVLDGSMALAVAYGGYLLADADLPPDLRWTVATWCLLGAGVLVGTVAASIAVRETEGRAVTEPAFPLLIAADAGALAGLIAGYYNARAREYARRAERATATLEFVNDLLRHDVRNHMSAVFVHADLIDRETDDEAVADSVATIREQAHEVTDLVENTGAVVEALSEETEFGPVDLAAVAADAAAEIAERFDAAVGTDLPESAPVAANEAIRSAVRNLVENAAEHNDAPDARVRVSVVEDGESVRLRVADNVAGIPDARKKEVFDARESGRHGGGLHLTETLVESFGGEVWVEDSDAGGAAFVMELPRRNSR